MLVPAAAAAVDGRADVADGVGGADVAGCNVDASTMQRMLLLLAAREQGSGKRLPPMLLCVSVLPLVSEGAGEGLGSGWAGAAGGAAVGAGVVNPWLLRGSAPSAAAAAAALLLLSPAGATMSMPAACNGAKASVNACTTAAAVHPAASSLSLLLPPSARWPLPLLLPLLLLVMHTRSGSTLPDSSTTCAPALCA